MRDVMRWVVTATIATTLALMAFSPGRVGGTARAVSFTRASPVGYMLCASSNGTATTGEMRLDRQLVQNRLTGGFGIAHSRVTRSGERCLRITMPAMKQQNAIVRAVGQRGIVTLAGSGKKPLPLGERVLLVCRHAGCVPGAPAGKTNLAAHPPRLRVVVPMREMARGSAYLSTDAARHPTVVYSLTASGTHIWCTFTTRHIAFYTAIVVDDRVLSDPLIQSAICGGKSEIVGMANQLTARTIVAFINSGPLPVSLHVV